MVYKFRFFEALNVLFGGMEASPIVERPLKGLSHERDVKNFDQNLKNLA